MPKSKPRFRQLARGVRAKQLAHRQNTNMEPAELAYHVPDQQVAIARSWQILDHLKSTTRGMDVEQCRVTVLRQLRDTNPFVVEEVILSACAGYGWDITRPNYTFDGGIDGEFSLGNQRWVVQTKRYAGWIDPLHVKKFLGMVRSHPVATGGLFATTGKVPQAAKYYEHKSNGHLMILSGDTLVDFLLNAISDRGNDRT